MTGRVKNYWEKENQKHQNAKQRDDTKTRTMIKSVRVIDLRKKNEKMDVDRTTSLCECITKLMK